MLVTVFTPTFNRAHLLPRVYESLLKQSFVDFEWIIVDDGSTDDTEDMVNGFLSEARLNIRYIRKKNGGKHTAVNRGVQEAKGVLFFIVDSDDYLLEYSLEIVAREFDKIKDDNKFAGVAGLDMFTNGEIAGSGLPSEYIDCNAMDIRFKHHVTGDLKEVFRTDVLKQFPFPEMEGERFCPEQLVWFRIARKYKLHYFNNPVYVAEYQEEGITSSITKVRMKSPQATIMCYAELAGYDVPFVQKMKAAINYWRFRFCSHRGKTPFISPLWCFVLPLSYIMHFRDLRCCS